VGSCFIDIKEKMKKIYIIMILGCLGVFVDSHSNQHRQLTNDQVNGVNGTCNGEIHPYSHHIHILFWQLNNGSVEGAFALRDLFMQTFNLSNDISDTCNDNTVWNTSYPLTNLCMFEPDYPQPEGPFLVSDWAVFVPNAFFSQTVMWIMQNRGNYDVLVHPNTGCEINDHAEWALWGGNKWELDTSIMHFNCPGCDQQNCANYGTQLMQQGTAFQCGLSISGNVFQLNNPTKYCNSYCQNWVEELENMEIPCPNMCDEFTTKSELEICRVTMKSLPLFQVWNSRC